MSNPSVYCVKCGKLIETREIDEALVVRIWEVCPDCLVEECPSVPICPEVEQWAVYKWYTTHP